MCVLYCVTEQDQFLVDVYQVSLIAFEWLSFLPFKYEIILNHEKLWLAQTFLKHYDKVLY